MQIERVFLRMISARFVMGVGVGSLLMGLLNVSRDLLLALCLLAVGGLCVLVSAAGHWNLKRAVKEA